MDKLSLTNKLLYTPTVKFDFTNPPVNPAELVDAMAEAMCDLGGVGLSANQVGLPYHVFVMGNPTDKDTIIPVFNSMIVDVSDEQEYAEEGCLSLPNYLITIKRPSEIRVRMTTLTGEVDTARFHGMTSRIFQHEHDHMEGIDFRSRASRRNKERADKNYKLFLRRTKKAA
jgi:peptide deformylase